LVGYGKGKTLDQLTDMLLAYQELRQKFVLEHPDMAAKLKAMELAHTLSRGLHKIKRA
jgi:hypothetical protein